MINSTNRGKHYKEESSFDWKNKNDFTCVSPKFYKFCNLDQDGFIHADGSLRFDFYIKKNGF